MKRLLSLFSVSFGVVCLATSTHTFAEKQYSGEFKNGVQLPAMVKIPEGSFAMGCASGGKCSSAEKPVHNVTVPAFELSATEVTFEQWDACVADGGCPYSPADSGWGRGDQPLVNVSWEHTQAFIQWLNVKTGSDYRLPSEAEWEYAARAGNPTPYSWGNAIGENNANCEGCGSRWDGQQTAPVGSFRANGLGLFDMSGNVWEWTQDCKSSYIGAPSHAVARTSGDCRQRMLRGGSWSSDAWGVRVSYRNSVAQDYLSPTIGFRLAR